MNLWNAKILMVHVTPNAEIFGKSGSPALGVIFSDIWVGKKMGHPRWGGGGGTHFFRKFPHWGGRTLLYMKGLGYKYARVRILKV